MPLPRPARFPEPPPPYIWDEPFTYPNGPLNGRGGWEASHSQVSCQVVSNAITRSAASSGVESTHAWALVPADLAADFTVAYTFVVPVAPSAGSGFQLRIGDDTNYLTLGLDLDAGALGPDVASVSWSSQDDGDGLASTPFAFNTTHIVTLVRVGQHISVLIDGIEVLADTSAFPTTPGAPPVQVIIDADVFATAPTLTRIVFTGTESV